MLIWRIATGNLPNQGPLRRGKSLLARDKDIAETGLSQFKRPGTLRRRKAAAAGAGGVPASSEAKSGFWDRIAPGPKDAWMIYCWILTCWIPPFLLSSCGMYHFPTFICLSHHRVRRPRETSEGDPYTQAARLFYMLGIHY